MGLKVLGLLVLLVHGAVWEKSSTGERFGAKGPPEIHQISRQRWKVGARAVKAPASTWDAQRISHKLYSGLPDISKGGFSKAKSPPK